MLQLYSLLAIAVASQLTLSEQTPLTDQQIRRGALTVTASQLANINAPLPGQLVDGFCQPLFFQDDYRGIADLRFVIFKQNQTGILAFEGTSSLEQWLLFNLNLDLEDCKMGADCGRVVEGFQNAYMDLNDAVFNATQVYPNLIITGHSLGAALATLAALSISYERPGQPILGLYTFGSPKIGDQKFIDTINSRLNQSDFGRFVSTDTRSVWNKVDWVTNVPLGSRYQQLGPSLEVRCTQSRDRCDSLQDLHSIQTYRQSIYELWNTRKGKQCIAW